MAALPGPQTTGSKYHSNTSCTVPCHDLINLDVLHGAMIRTLAGAPEFIRTHKLLRDLEINTIHDLAFSHRELYCSKIGTSTNPEIAALLNGVSSGRLKRLTGGHQELRVNDLL